MQEPTDVWVTEQLHDFVGALIEHQDECERDCHCTTAEEVDECYAPWLRVEQFIAAYGAWKEAAGRRDDGHAQNVFYAALRAGADRALATATVNYLRGAEKSEYDTRSAALVRLVEGE